MQNKQSWILFIIFIIIIIIAWFIYPAVYSEHFATCSRRYYRSRRRRHINCPYGSKKVCSCSIYHGARACKCFKLNQV